MVPLLSTDHDIAVAGAAAIATNRHTELEVVFR